MSDAWHSNLKYWYCSHSLCTSQHRLRDWHKTYLALPSQIVPVFLKQQPLWLRCGANLRHHAFFTDSLSYKRLFVSGACKSRKKLHEYLELILDLELCDTADSRHAYITAFVSAINAAIGEKVKTRSPHLSRLFWEGWSLSSVISDTHQEGTSWTLTKSVMSENCMGCNVCPAWPAAL